MRCPSEQLEICIQTGCGMSAVLPGIEFTILRRNLPPEIPPRPEKPPLLRDVKEVLTQQQWRLLCGEYERKWIAYRKAVVSHVAEQHTVGKLRRIQAMIRKLEIQECKEVV